MRTVTRKRRSVLNLASQARIRGSLHESGLSYNPDRTHSVSNETIGD